MTTTYYSAHIRYCDVNPTPWHPPAPTGPFNPRSVGAFKTPQECVVWCRSKGIFAFEYEIVKTTY